MDQQTFFFVSLSLQDRNLRGKCRAGEWVKSQPRGHVEVWGAADMASGFRWPSATCPYHTPSWQRWDGAVVFAKAQDETVGVARPVPPCSHCTQMAAARDRWGKQEISWAAEDVTMPRAQLGGQSWAWHGAVQVHC